MEREFRIPTVETFDLDCIFGLLTKEDIHRAVELSRGLTADAPRSIATLAVARSVLETKKEAVCERNFRQ